MTRTVIAGNWKMNKTPDEAVELAREIGDGLGDGTVEVVLCPAAVALTGVREALAGTSVKVGAQNMHSEESGAFTGEISPLMLKGLCEYVILGHSERRQLFGETGETVNRKVLAAIEHGLLPILCVGETLEERENGQANGVVGRQIEEGLRGIVDINGLIVAYEPVWAIGTGRAATPEIAQEIMGGVIQQTLTAQFGAHGSDIPLLYGGSVNPGNVASYLSQPSVNGALVGGASLDAGQFLEIVRLAGTSP